MNKYQTRQEEKQEDQKKQKKVDDWDKNSDLEISDEKDELDAAYKDLMMLEKSGIIPLEDVEDIMAYADK